MPVQPRLGLYLLILCAAACRTPADVERDFAKTLSPRLSPPPSASPGEAPSRVVRVRVYADLDYQSQVLRWQESVQNQLQHATFIARAEVGAVFSVVSM